MSKTDSTSTPETTVELPVSIKNLQAAGWTKEKFIKMWEDTKPLYDKELLRMQMLDAVDKGRLWQALKVTMPDYQLLPDTNLVTKVKTGLLASIYSVTKGANVVPTSQQDKDIIKNINVFLERIWALNKVNLYQFKAGERCALLNIGITQVGWDDAIMGGSGANAYQGDLSLKNINPMKFRRDPYATELDTSSYCFTYDIFHESIFEGNDLYAEGYKRYKASPEFTDRIPISLGLQQLGQAAYNNAEKYHVLMTAWVRDQGKIHEIHIIDMAHILYAIEDIQPSIFPFAIMYCNEPAEDLIGASECAKIFANDVVYNLMDSIQFTAEYKNQKPPKFVSADSQINMDTFIKHGSEADKTFICRGDASKAVHYHEFPKPSPSVPVLQSKMLDNIGNVTGVDDRYMGRDTGSVLTTGGMEDMLSRVTLIDAPKIILYEEYAKQLTKLILFNFIHHKTKRELFFQNPRTRKWETIKTDFSMFGKDTVFNYEINISNELPRNKQRIEATALAIMEKQLQYEQAGHKVQLITPEEMLMFIDLGPLTEFMLERMGVQRMDTSLETVSRILTTYSSLLQSGLDPKAALYETASMQAQNEQGIAPDQMQPADSYTPPVEGLGLPPNV